MTVRRTQGDLRVRELRGEPDRLVDRYEGVLAAVPDVHEPLDVRRTKAPPPGADDVVVDHRADAVRGRSEEAPRCRGARRGVGEQAPVGRRVPASITAATSAGWRRTMASTASAVRAHVRGQRRSSRNASRTGAGSPVDTQSPGVMPLTTAVAVTRSGSSCAQASAYGPPADTPTTAKRSYPR